MNQESVWKVVDYMVTEGNKVTIERRVNRLIKQGWQPIGGIAESQDKDKVLFYQAMVKYEAIKK
jgi:hypothetical protein